MRIGIIAPVTHSYPPSGYGPWERVTHDLVEQLVSTGHDVVLFAAAESKTRAHLVPTIDRPLTAIAADERRAAEDRHIENALAHVRQGEFDIVHSHLHVHVLNRIGRERLPVITTLHGSAWNSAHHGDLLDHAWRPFVSLSNRERDFLPELNYVATVPNGIRTEEFPPGDGGGGYLAFVGRLAPEKAPHLAIETARRSGRTLMIAGVVDDTHADYASRIVREAGSGVEVLGQLDRTDTSRLLGDAVGLLMPLMWEEPFGLSVVESLSSGTPVVAWRRGSMAEIVEHDRTGFLVNDVDNAVEAVSRLSSLSRADCARSARERFSDAVMASGYVAAYRKALAHGAEDVIEGGDANLDATVRVAER